VHLRPTAERFIHCARDIASSRVRRRSRTPRATILSGLVRMFFPIELAAIAASVAQSTGLITGTAAVLLVLGGFLSFKAYGRG
jgi:hypothetical protein